MSRIFITGDVHGEVMSRLSNKNFPIAKELNREDLVFITGDFGSIWNAAEDQREKHILNWLNDCKFTTMIIGGNHENWDRLRDLPLVEKFGVVLGEIRPNVFFVPNGTLIEYAGKRIFCMGGAMSTDQHHRTEGVSWWAGEIPTYEEMDFGTKNLERVGYKVDLILSHTMPIRNITMFCMANGFNHERVTDPTANYLSFIAEHAKFDQWFCGHFHENQVYEDVMVLYDFIIDPDEFENMDRGEYRNYGREHLNPLW